MPRPLALLLLFLAACPTPSGYQAELDALKNTSINDTVHAWGAPTKVVPLAMGHQLYVWEQRSELRTQERMVTKRDPQSGAMVSTLEGGARIPLDCTTELEVAGDGRILRGTARGPACLGFGPSAPPTVPSVTSAPVAADAAPPGAPGAVEGSLSSAEAAAPTPPAPEAADGAAEAAAPAGRNPPRTLRTPPPQRRRAQGTP